MDESNAKCKLRSFQMYEIIFNYILDVEYMGKKRIDLVS